MNKLVFLAFLFLFSSWGFSQTISGKLSLLANQPIKLEGFNGFKTYPIASSTIDEMGNFKLSYSNKDFGVGYLISADDKPLFVILNGEDIELRGEALSYTATTKVINGQENLLFEQYASEHPRREQALSAWIYLEKIYILDTLFSVNSVPAEAIQKEKKRIKQEDAAFIAALPNQSYLRWFLPIRKLVSSVSTIAQYRTEEIPDAIDAFRKIDYTDSRLYKSGLLKDAIESHFWLIENSGRSLDSVFIEMQHSIDAMLNNLVDDEKKLNEIADYLFDLLERHSLFKASEYLALKVLNEVSCTINNDLANQLETYRAMKKGNTAPNILFSAEYLLPNSTKKFKQLSDIKSNYTLVVFGASWCPKCMEEVPEMAYNYPKWQQEGLEVVFISLDDNRKEFIDFAAKFPFLSYCDLKKWESPVATDYYVFATPTMYLLNSQREIILRPTSLLQMNAWVDWYLVQKNPLPVIEKN